MKKVLFPILVLLLITACKKENVATTETHDYAAGALDRHANLVTICHLNEEGEFQPIQVNINALQVHLAHGDYLPDADGDGYSALGACTGSMDDCDDNNADVHPGATEICDNGLDDDCDGATDGADPDCPAGGCSYPFFDLEELMNYEYQGAIYYDSGEENCEPDIIEGVLMVNNLMSAYAYTVTTDVGQKTVVGFNRYVTPQVSCEAIVGTDITLEQYEAAQEIIRDAIEAYSGKINFCNYLIGGDQPSSLSRSGDILKKMDQQLRERAGK